MTKKGRYSTAGVVEGEFEPGSRNRILKNLQGIKLQRDMNITETNAYNQVTEEVIDLFAKGHSFTAADICKIHKSWLGDIYVWAGEYRNVNMSKNNFQFASAHLIPKLMQEFEKKVLSRYTPCRFSNIDEIAKAIAVVHTEFILIHPFREGNGRLGRLISVLMGLQANLPILNFESVKGKKKQEKNKGSRERSQLK
jgi:cell filamentation protein